MSKAQLKKALMQMTHEEVVEAVTEAYAANKEVKDYFEFFLNPDLGALRKKFDNLILKELSRQRRGECTARLSHVRSYIKDFIGYGIAPLDVIELYLDILRWGAQLEARAWNPDRVERGYVRILNDLLTYADRQQQYSVALEGVTAVMSLMHPRSHLRYTLALALEGNDK